MSSPPPPKLRFPLQRFADIKLGATRPYVIKGVIPRPGLTVFWGPPKCGKSFLVSHLALHVALGWACRDHRVQQGPVVYIALEGSEGFAARIEAFRLHFLAEADEPTDVPFFLVAGRLDLVQDHAQLIQEVKAQIGATLPILIVIDTLNRSLTGSESSDEDMGAYIKAADALKEAFGAAVVIVHHCGIDGTRPRGHTSLGGALDAQIAVKRDDAGTISAKVEWMKDGPEGEEILSRLETVELGTDQDGDPITSCVIVPTDAQPKKKGLTGDARIALDGLTDLVARTDASHPGSPYIPTGACTVPQDVWRDLFYSRKVADNPDKAKAQEAKRQAFKRAVKNLQDGNAIGVHDGLVWLTK